MESETEAYRLVSFVIVAWFDDDRRRTCCTVSGIPASERIGGELITLIVSQASVYRQHEEYCDRFDICRRSQGDRQCAEGSCASVPSPLTTVKVDSRASVPNPRVNANCQ